MHSEEQYEDSAEPKILPKTSRYLNRLADETNALFAKAVEYRQLIDQSKTSLSRQVYSKKLKKIVDKLDANMALFSTLENAKAKTKQSDENVV